MDNFFQHLLYCCETDFLHFAVERRMFGVTDDTGYPHDGCADNTAYRQDHRADKRRYLHDREIDIQMLKMFRNGYVLS